MTFATSIGKLPTIVGLSTYTGITSSTFNYQMQYPNELLHDACMFFSDTIHDMTLNATLDGKIKPELYGALNENWWNRTKKTGNVVVINNQNNASKNDVLDAIEFTMNDDEKN